MRRFLSSACFVVGTVWSAAGVLKFLFGIRLTLPVLPPLGLEQVAVGRSIAIGLALFAFGAVLARARRQPETAGLEDSTREVDHLLDAPIVPMVPTAQPSARQPNQR
jgi:hypothetical protein